MPLRHFLTWCCAGAFLSWASVAAAFPSGLVTIHSADILAPGHLCASVGLTTVADDEDDVTLYTQVGLLPWLEAGYDYSFTGSSGVGNVKVGQVVGTTAVAVGVRNLGGADVEAEWYAVVTPGDDETAPVRVHLGALEREDSLAPYLGLEIPVKSATILAEGVGGADGSGALGVVFPVTERFSAIVSALVGDADGTQWYVELGCTLPWR
jgi:hypothetical protein